MSGAVGQPLTLPTPITTRGDTVVGNSSGAPSRLAAGTRNQELYYSPDGDLLKRDRPYVDIRAYAADANPLASAVAVLSATGGDVEIVGEFTLTSQTSLAGKQHAAIVGRSGAVLKHNAGTDALVLIPRTAYFSSIEKLLITRPNGGTSTGHGILYQGDGSGSSAFHEMRQVEINDLGGDGIRCEQGNHVTAVRVYSVNNDGAGLTLATGSSQPSNVNAFFGCAFRVNAVGVTIEDVDDAFFYAPVIESNTGWGMTIAAGCLYVHVYGGHFENNGTGGGGAGHLSLSGNYCHFDGCYFSSGKPITIAGDGNLFVGCALNDSVTISASADGTTFIKCDFSALPTDSGTNTCYIGCTLNGSRIADVLPNSVTIGGSSSDTLTVKATETHEANLALKTNALQLQWQDAGSSKWIAYLAGGATWNLRDMVNGRMHMTTVAGASVTAASTAFASNVTVSGRLDHDGDGVGFYGTTPVTKQTGWTTSNVATDRTFDANATTLDELADIVGTLIADLIRTGIIGT